MNEYEADERAAATVFFFDGEFDGINRRVCRINYLVLLNLREDSPRELQMIRALEAEHTREVVAADAVLLLRARNWRFNLIGCFAALAGARAPDLIETLWTRIYGRGWVSPQLAVTAALIDSDFQVRALRCLGESESDCKLFDAIDFLLRERFGTKLPPELSEKVRAAVRQGDEREAGGVFARHWLERACLLFGI